MSDLRYRTVANGATSSSLPPRSFASSFNSEKGLSYGTVHNANPSYEGKVLKLHIPIFYSLLPFFLQRYLMNISVGNNNTINNPTRDVSTRSQSRFKNILEWCNLIPTWKARQLVVLGNYVYKFKDESSQEPKGRPIELIHTTVQIQSPSTSTSRTPLPPYCFASFTITSPNHKDPTIQYAVQSQEEAQVWVQTLRQQKQEAITRSMGHANHVPYHPAWKALDYRAEQLVKRKTRIRERVEKAESREMEMVAMSMGVGSTSGSMPTGYYS